MKDKRTYFEEIIRPQKKIGKRVVAFCWEAGVSYSTFRYLVKKSPQTASCRRNNSHKTESKVMKLHDEVLWLRRLLFGHETDRYIPADPNKLKFSQVLPQSKIGKALAHIFTIYLRVSRYVQKGRCQNDNHKWM